MEEFLKVGFSDDAISDVVNEVDPLDANKAESWVIRDLLYESLDTFFVQRCRWIGGGSVNDAYLLW